MLVVTSLNMSWMDEAIQLAKLELERASNAVFPDNLTDLADYP